MRPFALLVDDVLRDVHQHTSKDLDVIRESRKVEGVELPGVARNIKEIRVQFRVRTRIEKCDDVGKRRGAGNKNLCLEVYIEHFLSEIIPNRAYHT